MFYSQCNDCNERWELGTASTCKCPEELPAYTFKQPLEPVFAFTNMKPNHNITFHNGEKQVGVLDFNGPEMVFSGDMDESAKVFFDFIAKSFKARLEQERADERNFWPLEMEAMERQVNILTDALAEEREACAKLVDAAKAGEEDWDSNDWNQAVEFCASRIRARSNT